MDIKVKETYYNNSIKVNGNTPNDILFNGEHVRALEYNGKILNDVHVDTKLRVGIIYSVTRKNEAGSGYYPYAYYGRVNVKIEDNGLGNYNAIHNVEVSNVNVKFSIDNNACAVNSYNELVLLYRGEFNVNRVKVYGGSINFKLTDKCGKEYNYTLEISSTTLSEDNDVWRKGIMYSKTIMETLKYKN